MRIRFCLAVWMCIAIGGCSQAARVRSESVTFASDGARLAGTLYLPAKHTRHPAVVLFHGSGPQPRDSARAEWFAGIGVAALAYDKRGVGESTGDFGQIPFPELVNDGLAAIAFLKARPDIDAGHIGVWGLSQGGWLGPLAASRSRDVSFVIAVSGPGVTPGEQMIFYYANQLRDHGLSEAEVAEASGVRRQVWSYLSTGAGFKEAKGALERAKAKPWYSDFCGQYDHVCDKFEHAGSARNDDWFKTEMNYDPVATLQKVKVPALFLFGGEDRLVPVGRSVEIIRRSLTEAGHGDFTIEVIPGADHGLHFPAGSGELAPRYEQAMKLWLLKRIS